MQVTDSNADEAFHVVADFVKHPANLAVDSLTQNDPQSSGLERVNPFQAGTLAVERHAFEELRRERRIPRTVNRDFVFLLDFVTRVGEALREIAVVGEEKKAFGLGVEPANVEKPRQMRREQVEDGIARVRIASGGDESGRLMEHEVEPALGVDQFAIDLDVVAVAGVDAEIGADLAVDRNPAGRDQFIAMPPRTDSGCGKKTVQAHWLRAKLKRPASSSGGRALSGRP